MILKVLNFGTVKHISSLLHLQRKLNGFQVDWFVNDLTSKFTNTAFYVDKKLI